MAYNHKHPYKNSPEWKAWYRMNRNYSKNQIDRGWLWWRMEVSVNEFEDINRRNYGSFRNFIGPRPIGHALIRLDKNLPFRIGNVRWGTHSENSKARGPMKKFSCARDEELIKELRQRGYTVKKS